MVNFTNIATAAVGALVISTACIAAATGPAYAVDAETVSYTATDSSVTVRAEA
ncbi:MAG TPA: hypothetical protein VFO69_11840 [Allosphingosinicella sp.]|nr:hypothetical protein [Allosphingosinicella sp.]